ncbi:hypothetical protein ELI02_10635 [Rhizobium leguminosarum]|uniref:Uncharacterized protein n=1 Tax=Rhizobium leguminosarum TaxID=384 RepID=A0A4Q8XZF2_RHILE|nr:hypothetical protein ELI41_11625 [Rhizobium leguminosarum]TAV53783.1 hypothetical protein ELI29_12325 [Rhizobium leguminosarum]TAX55929.1 hypothetical protein ELI01_12190 [Rhizobium leguminosarum]TAX60435.1 hypothetical protein ELI02_10635 [Rhizobium leguminosarum]TAX72263.1 hypothetical protein ELI03_11170 [Rhizobium leguminosarum]
MVTAPQYREGAPPAKEAALEHFRFSSNHGNALFPCFHAIPDAKPRHTFAGIALKSSDDHEIGEAPDGGRSVVVDDG